jgi:hypothetical protein
VRIGCEVSRRVSPTSKTVPTSRKQIYEEIRRPILDNCKLEHGSTALPKPNCTTASNREDREDRGNSKICASAGEEEEDFDC